MSDQLSYSAALKRWEGDRGTYHLISITGDIADTIASHEKLHRFEYGKGRGFGSVKTLARIGGTRWKTSLFPQDKAKEWILLVSKKVMQAENLAVGDELTVELELI